MFEVYELKSLYRQKLLRKTHSEAMAVSQLEEPIRAELFSSERLEQHGESLAFAHKLRPPISKLARLLDFLPLFEIYFPPSDFFIVSASLTVTIAAAFSFSASNWPLKSANRPRSEKFPRPQRRRSSRLPENAVKIFALTASVFCRDEQQTAPRDLRILQVVARRRKNFGRQKLRRICRLRRLPEQEFP